MTPPYLCVHHPGGRFFSKIQEYTGLLTLKVSLEYFVSHFPIFSHTKLFVIVPVLFTKDGADPKHSHTRLLLLFPFIEIISVIPQHEEVD